MGNYIPSTTKEQQDMLHTTGHTSFDGLYKDVPDEACLNRELKLPPGATELEVRREIESIGAKNQVFTHIFRGAGAYHHYIPSIVKYVTAKEEFVTAYTPYQAEISQGILQSIFEYQTMICELTGMDAANASVYDGASAAAEAVNMCLDRKRTTAVISACAHPDVIRTVKTYCYAKGTRLIVAPKKGGQTDTEGLKKLLNGETACVYIQQPNYYGILEDIKSIEALVHGSGSKLIMGCNPISLALLKTPGEYGADIAVGEGQPLGMPLSFGGPYLGFMAATSALTRKLPGRIAGETTDAQGRRAFVLTLQAREQHIRREKAGSNICSNQALCAMTAAVYMTAMGPSGLSLTAQHCTAKAHYLQQKLEAIGLKLKYHKSFFHEFVTTSSLDAEKIMDTLKEHGYLGGLPLNIHDILWCTTEMNTKEEIDQMVSIIEGVTALEASI